MGSARIVLTCEKTTRTTNRDTDRQRQTETDRDRNRDEERQRQTETETDKTHLAQVNMLCRSLSGVLLYLGL